MNNDNTPMPIDPSQLTNAQLEAGMVQLSIQQMAIFKSQEILVAEWLSRQAGTKPNVEEGSFDMGTNNKPTTLTMPKLKRYENK